MNIGIAKSRMAEVLAVDSINSLQADFFATHVPFKKLTFSGDLNDKNHKEYLNEDDVYGNIFNSEKENQHQFILVMGQSGVGKSHFIRWINAKLDSDDEWSSKNAVLLIKRSDNTLKGTIRQLLNMDEVKNIANKEAYERLVRANQTISETKFKNTIYNSFIVEIQSDEKESELSRVQKKNLISLLQNDSFQSLMMDIDGPVDRIYNKIASNANAVAKSDSNAYFTIDDFTFNVDFSEKLQKNGADRRAINFVNDILNDDDNAKKQKIVSYVNSFIEQVIQSCAGIQSGDFEMIFGDIRRELKKQGKSLILLVEDITSFTGLNQELLNALFTSHTGENESSDYCRLISFVGITDQYFKDKDRFRQNYIDRITSMIEIYDDAVGENVEDLCQFVARYLNAMSLERDEIQDWKINGAVQSDIPVHYDGEMNIWGYTLIEGKKFSLFPFTKSAIKNLVDYVEKEEQHRTPRYIIKKIIEPAVSELINNPRLFPDFCKNWKSPLESNIKYDDVVNKINNIVSNMGLNSQYADKVRKVIGFWGNSSIDYINGKLGGLSAAIYIELGLKQFYESVTGKKIDIGEVTVDPSSDGSDDTDTVSEPNIDDTNIQKEPKIDPEQKKREEKYIAFRDMVTTWHNNSEKKLTRIQDVRDAVCEFVFEAINWQQYGISLSMVNTVKESQYSLIAFDRQDQKLDKSYIILEDNDETYSLLICFGKYVFLGKKSWDFDDSESEIYTATLWLEKHKIDIIETVRGDCEKNVPVYIRNAMIFDVIAKTLNGTIEAKRTADIKRNTILRKENQLNKALIMNSGHCKEWTDVLAMCYPEGKSAIGDTILRYVNINMGAAENSKKMIVNQSLYTSMMKAAKEANFVIGEQILDMDSKVKSRRDTNELCKKISDKVAIAVKVEIAAGREMANKINSYFGYDDDLYPDKDDIRQLLNNVSGFYDDAVKVGSNISVKSDKATELGKNASSFENAISIITANYENVSVIEQLMAFSQDPIGVLRPLEKFLEQVESDISTVSGSVEQQKEMLIRKGAWDNSKDPRFEKEKDDFESLYTVIMEV